MKKYVQITAGRGPVECARAVTLIAQKLYEDIPQLKLVESEPHTKHSGCFMSMTFVSAQEIPPVKIAQWAGTVLWRSTRNPYRPGHKRSNWFVGVRFFDAFILPDIREKDIVYESCRSGGKGGQNVNKVETTVRALHLPTGLSVRCSEERSQYQNKILARERLLLKLLSANEATIARFRTDNWSHHDSLRRGNPVRTFIGPL